ncbi:MAG: alpha/beta hydrolase [Sphingobacterium sp.]|jgi:pimeloyl-ACP methyl ester carboxylesterase|uniref:alpha/beta hydrolase family protein n=1 Tax=Sphingobacterium sp. TaxID=341027 RepID=UPI00282C10C3|nr:alpha/beta hydrolase [Sphingobacterium sp.]MDR0262983.1 alpha/beta hydrolase [Sphingobacterium sp.]
MRKILYLFIICFHFSCSHAQTFDGSWKGEVEVSGQKLLLVFNIQKDSAGKWNGTFESPMQTAQKFAINQIRIEQDSIWMDVKNIGLVYAGFLDRDKDVMKGVMKQGPFESAMILVRSENEQSGLSRKQDVFPPYSYTEEEVQFINSAGNAILTGSLTYPKSGGPFPAVVLVNGSGQQNRDSEMFGHRPFKVLADHLTKNGFAVLRYDDRGVGGSKGEVNLATTIDFASDANAAVDFLSKKTSINGDKIGIIGHSEGALIAEIVASENNKVKYIVLLSGPVIKGDSLLILQSYALGKVSGLSETTLEANKANNRKLYNILLEDKPPKVLAASLEEELIHQNNGNPLTPDMKIKLSPMMSPWFRTFLRIDPAYYLKQVKVPVFASFGGKDVQVPANENIYCLQRLHLNTTDVTIKDYPNLNHLFQNAQTGKIEEYFENWESFNEQLMNDLTKWLKLKTN